MLLGTPAGWHWSRPALIESATAAADSVHTCSLLLSSRAAAALFSGSQCCALHNGEGASLSARSYSLSSLFVILVKWSTFVSELPPSEV